MHGHHEDSTKVNLLLTGSSQVSEVGPGEGEQQAARGSAHPNLKDAPFEVLYGVLKAGFCCASLHPVFPLFLPM